MLAMLAVRGTPFEAGAALGRFGAAAVHRHLLPSAAWAGLMRWRGSARPQAMAELVRSRFPRVQAELEGLFSRSTSVGHTEVRRPLLTVGEVGALPGDRLLLLKAGVPPAVVWRRPYYADPVLRARAAVPPPAVGGAP